MNRSTLLKRAAMSRRPQSGRMIAYTRWLLEHRFLTEDCVAFLGGVEQAGESLTRMFDAAAPPITPDELLAEVQILLHRVPRGSMQYRARKQLMRWLVGCAVPRSNGQ